MNEVTIVRHINGIGCELAAEYCRSGHEVRKAVGHILDCWEDGDQITFQVVTE